MPYKSDSNGNSNFWYPTPEQARNIFKKQKIHEDLRSNYFKLVLDLETTIFGLRTYNNAKINFPEAFTFFPEEKHSVALSLNIPDLVERLK